MPDQTPGAYETAVAKLRAADTEGRTDLAAVLVKMLTPAGALSQWDSETIEHVLFPSEDAVKAAGIPWIDTADDAVQHRYWAAVADEIGIYTDYEDDHDRGEEYL